MENTCPVDIDEWFAELKKEHYESMARHRLYEEELAPKME